MSVTGPKTDLTEEIFKQIRECILDGLNIRETAIKIFDTLEEFNNLEEKEKEKEKANYIQKFYNWNYDNYLNFNTRLEGWKRDRLIMLATNNVKEILVMPTSDRETLKVVADISKFTLETLDKKNYSKRNELTGEDGKDLVQFQINQAIAEKNGIPSNTIQCSNGQA